VRSGATHFLAAQVRTGIYPSGAGTGTGAGAGGREGVGAVGAAAVGAAAVGAVAQAGRAHDHAVTGLRHSSCGSFLVTCGNDRALRLWEADSGRLLPTNFSDCAVPVAQLPFDIGLACFAHSADDVLVVPAGRGSDAAAGGAGAGGAAVGEGDLLLVPMHADGRAVRVLRGHMGRVTAVVHRRPLQQLVTAGADGMIFLWSAQDACHDEGRDRDRERAENRQRLGRLGVLGVRYDFETVRQGVQGTLETQ
ncbi:hypothetical protein B484DRAFT_410649, partial [Ochromonadaceae sp. CCMP2298]